MAITPICTVLSNRDFFNQSKKENPGTTGTFDRCTGMTKTLVKSTSLSYHSHSQEYRKEAFEYLRSFYRKNGRILRVFVQSQTGLLQALSASPTDPASITKLRDYMSRSSDTMRGILHQALHSLYSEGLDETSAKADAMHGLQHVIGTYCSTIMLSDMIMLAPSEKKPIYLAQLQTGVNALVDMHERLSTLSANPQNVDCFLYSALRQSSIDKSV